MFAAVLSFPSHERPKPFGNWVFEPHPFGGTNALMDYAASGRGVWLPEGISDENRDSVLSAYESGLSIGKHEGRQALQFEVRRLLNII